MRPARTLLRGADGQPLLRSATTRADGSPRFLMPLIPQLIENDAGIKHLVDRELNYDGFERPTRDILDAHLQPGDLFLDIGAHWGAMSLSAITGPAVGVRAIAVEPAPLNVTMLMRAIITNRVADSLIVVSAAAGEHSGVSELRFGSTMGNALSVDPARQERYGLQVPVVSIDALLKDLAVPAEQRIVIKIDVEGFEPEVLRGAAETIQSGRVALIVWERGQEYRENDGVRSRAIKVRAWLEDIGYRHYTLPYHEWGGPLIPATDDWFYSNIFSFAPGAEKRDVYPQDVSHRPPYEPVHRMERTRERMAAVTNMCIAARTSDGIRWADPFELQAGADERAGAAARFIAAGQKVLDLGCGRMALAQRLPQGCSYQPADLIARSDACVVADLNQSQFPEGSYDAIALLNVLEYVHDVAALLRRCARAAPRLVLSYEPARPAYEQSRREAGFFNDLSGDQLTATLAEAGLRVAEKVPLGSAVLLHCATA